MWLTEFPKALARISQMGTWQRASAHIVPPKHGAKILPSVYFYTIVVANIGTIRLVII